MIEIAAAAIAVLLALPASGIGRSRLWLVLLAAGPVSGAAGWTLLPAPHGPLLQLAGTVTLLLPATVVILAVTRRHTPDNLAEAAAACGASPLQTLMQARIRPALPALAAGLALALVLAHAITPMLAPLAARP